MRSVFIAAIFGTNSGVKTALLLELLSVGIAADGGTEPKDDQVVQDQPNEVMGTLTISFLENEVPNAQLVQDVAIITGDF